MLCHVILCYVMLYYINVINTIMTTIQHLIIASIHAKHLRRRDVDRLVTSPGLLAILCGGPESVVISGWRVRMSNTTIHDIPQTG